MDTATHGNWPPVLTARPSSEIIGETDSRDPMMTHWTVSATTEEKVRDHVRRITSTDGVFEHDFCEPAIVQFADDTCIGWWRSIGYTKDVINVDALQ